MNKILFLLMIVISSTFLFAQGNREQTGVNSYQGQKAVLFEINGLNFSSYRQGLGLKKWISPRLALVPGILFSYENSESKPEDQGIESRVTEWNLGFFLGLERHFGSGDRFSPYLSGTLGTERVSFTDDLKTSGSLQPWGRKNEMGYWYMSLNIGGGMEWFVRRNISLAAQYGLEIGYDLGSQRQVKGEEEKEYDLRRFRFGVGAFSLVLAIYF